MKKLPFFFAGLACLVLIWITNEYTAYTFGEDIDGSLTDALQAFGWFATGVAVLVFFYELFRSRELWRVWLCTFPGLMIWFIFRPRDKKTLFGA